MTTGETKGIDEENKEGRDDLVRTNDETKERKTTRAVKMKRRQLQLRL